MVHLRLPQPGTSIAPTAMTQPFPSSSLLFPFLHPVYLLCFVIVCIFFLSHCVLFFCHMGLVAYARERHLLSSEYQRDFQSI